MRVGRFEAVDVFSKWLSERSLLRCDFEFSGFAATFRARVVWIDPGEVKLLSDDTTSEAAVRLTDEVAFAYGDPRGFPEEARLYDCSLVLDLPSGDRISFTQIIEQTPR